MCDLNKGFKLKELNIEKYQILKNIKVDFCDKNNQPLPIIVLAGINGSGKTTILDVIADYNLPYNLSKNNYLKILSDNENLTIDYKILRGLEVFKNNQQKNNIIHIKALDDNIEDVKRFILSYFRKKSRELDSISKATIEIGNFIDKIFDGMNLSFKLVDIDDTYRDKEKVTFKNLINKISNLNSSF